MISNEPLIRTAPSPALPSRVAQASGTDSSQAGPAAAGPAAAPVTDRSDLQLPAGSSRPWIELFDEPIHPAADSECTEHHPPMEPAAAETLPTETQNVEPDAAPAGAEPESHPSGPSLVDILKHKGVIAPHQPCAEMPKLLSMLAKAGYKVEHEGNLLDGEALRALQRFQEDSGVAKPGSPYSGTLGTQTLKELQSAQKWGVMDHQQAKANADAAKQRIHGWNSHRGCFAQVAQSLDRAYGAKQEWLQGGHAKDAIGCLQGPGSRFRQIHIQPEDFGKLPDGAVIVYHPLGGHTSGHIDIIASDGGQKLGISDFRRSLTISPWKGYSDAQVWKNGVEIFVPKR